MRFKEFIKRFEEFNNKDSNLINNLIEEVKGIVEKEPILLDIDNGIKTILVGDIHGDYKTLLSIIEIFLDEDYNRIIFLGDYVDRGFSDMQIKVLNILLHLKKYLPDRVHLLRGNHEWRYINAEYGFREAIYHHLNPFLYYRYNELFEELPVCVRILKPKVFCVHGGIPVSDSDNVYSIKDILHITKKYCFEDKLGQQLLWNDPSDKIEGIKKNYRGLGYIFGIKPFKKFMKHNKLEYCIRSHEIVKNGNCSYFDDKLITIFSCKSYSKRIKPSILIIDKEKNIIIRKINHK